MCKFRNLRAKVTKKVKSGAYRAKNLLFHALFFSFLLHDEPSRPIPEAAFWLPTLLFSS